MLISRQVLLGEMDGIGLASRLFEMVARGGVSGRIAHQDSGILPPMKRAWRGEGRLAGNRVAIFVLKGPEPGPEELARAFRVSAGVLEGRIDDTGRQTCRIDDNVDRVWLLRLIIGTQSRQAGRLVGAWYWVRADSTPWIIEGFPQGSPDITHPDPQRVKAHVHFVLHRVNEPGHGEVPVERHPGVVQRNLDGPVDEIAGGKCGPACD